MKHGGNVWQGGKPERWLDFSANLRPEGTPDWVMQVMRETLRDARYYPDPAMAEARRGLAAYAGVSEERILPTAGGTDAIDLALSLSTGTVYVQPVTFGEYAARAAARGRTVALWQGNCAPGDTVVICNPNNPTGQALGRVQTLALFRQVVGQGGELLADEAFIDYCPQHSLRGENLPGLTVVGSLTKILCIPGVRLGYLCATEETLARLQPQPWAVNVCAVAIACALPEHLCDLDTYTCENRRRRATFTDGLRALGAEVAPSEASFVLARFDQDMSAAAEHLRQRSVLVRTCDSFGLDGRYWRLAVKTEEQNERLLALLGEELLCAENR